VEWVAVALCLVFALLVQVATNFSNDHQDFVRGADNAERRGPRRAVASGLVSPESMRRAAFGTFGAAFVVGLGLIPYGGWWLLPLGVLCLLSGYAYTGGPRPLAYHALGDLFVLVFFGLVAVCATHFVLVGRVGVPAVLAGLSIGLLAVNLLVVNNTRDLETDGPAGKRTLAVVLGEHASKVQFKAQLACAFLLIPAIAYAASAWWALLPWLTGPYAVALAERFDRTSEGPGFNRVLGGSALQLMLFGLLLTLGLALG
jgi:1,4-dihydroxy-2-naphthoate octaprenyltransferase